MESTSIMSVAALDSSHSYIFDAPNQTGSPERMLILAVLERAILDFVGNDRKESIAAKDWIYSEDNSDVNEPFTFVWVCNQLDLNHKGVVDMITAMPKRGTNRIAPWYFNKAYQNKKQI